MPAGRYGGWTPSIPNTAKLSLSHTLYPEVDRIGQMINLLDTALLRTLSNDTTVRIIASYEVSCVLGITIQVSSHDRL